MQEIFLDKSGEGAYCTPDIWVQVEWRKARFLENS